ncbi:MAG: hydrolase, CocE/NonD family [Conexibacter sp.]|nr:hydrolase, CocE/NonD family [Conexibacter sp.]
MGQTWRRVAGALAASIAIAGAAAGPVAGAGAAEWTPYSRPAQFGTVTVKDVPITMRDGTVLRANVTRPDQPGRYPVLVTQTPYGKDGAVILALAGQSDGLVQRGYVQVTVDVRGTGASGGAWDSFGPAEQQDGYDVVEWAAGQDFSDGNVGLDGPSYMGLNQLYTAALRPPHLKAIFPVVPMADGYRDITFSGGDVNVAFIPLWLGLVTAGGVVPPQSTFSGSPAELISSLSVLSQHIGGALSFTAPTLIGATTGGSIAYDGPFWKTRSPIEVLDRIEVPAFVVGGLHDLFQRGEPLVYERLKSRVPARLLMGPWTHLGGSQGAGLPRDGVPSLTDLQLRWFDRYLKNIDTNVDAIPKVTQYAYGDERYETQLDWPDPRLDPERWYLRGGQAVSQEAPGAGETPQTFVQHPLAGVCTMSTGQWTAGLGEQLPCFTDDRPNALSGGASYVSAPVPSDLRLSGPVAARLWVTTTASDASVAVRVDDVAPDGTSTGMTTGWQTAAFRAVDASRSRTVRGHQLQPWHPYTQASVLPVRAGEPTALDVEIFPANWVLKAGHRLKVVVDPSDFPHALPPAPALLARLGGRVSVLTDPEHPSAIELPVVGSTCAAGSDAAGDCAALPVPDLTRGG